MSWREIIKAAKSASFRGVEFKTVDAEMRIGRRTVVHEYPERDRPYPEDLGKRAKEWHVEGFVIGDDYLDKRDALVAALDAKGPGELKHPRYGTLQVSVFGHASVRESTKEGGIARFSIQFVDAGANVFPGAREDTVAAVDKAATRCEAAAQSRYVKALNTAGPLSVLQSAINAAKTTVAGILRMVRQVTSLGGLSALVRSVVQLAGSIAALIRTPVVFVQGLRSIFADLVAGVGRPLAALQELRSLFQTHVRPVPATGMPRAGSTAAKVLANQQAHTDLVRALTLSAQGRMVAVAISVGLNPEVGASTAGSDSSAGGTTSTSTATTFSSSALLPPYEAPIATAAQALALRDALLEQIDSELETTEPEPEMAAALQDLRSSVARDVSVRAELLRERSSFKPMAVLPALALAHRVYQDATRVDELIARNAVRNPNFVPTLPLEVLR